MSNLATWIRPKDAKSFRAIFSKHPEIKVWNALNRKVPFEKMDGLLLTGGSDISPEFLRQEVVDPSLINKDVDPERDRWELNAVQEALSRGLPIFAICKGLQVFNVGLGGTLKLDIKGHNLPEQREQEIQTLRHSRRASHRFSKVNSAHHQAIEQLGDDLESGSVVRSRWHHRASTSSKLSLCPRWTVSPRAESSLRFALRGVLCATEGPRAFEELTALLNDTAKQATSQSCLLLGFAMLFSPSAATAKSSKRRCDSRSYPEGETAPRTGLLPAAINAAGCWGFVHNDLA